MHHTSSRIFSTFSAAVIIALLSVCSPKNSPSGPDKPDVPDVTDVQTVEKTESKIDSLFSAGVAASDDTVAVLESIAQALENDSSVDSVTVSEQGLAIQYENGMRGGIFVSPLDEDEPLEELPTDSLFKLGKQRRTVADNAPVKQALLLVVHYNERVQQSAKILSTYSSYLPMAGFSVAKKFGTVMLDDLCSLSNKEYIHIYSHGWAWPKSTSITDVYLMTNEEVSAATSQRYKSDLLSGDIITADYHGKRIYFVNSRFITKYNTFTKTLPLFYGGFCFSYLGSWSQSLFDAGVSVYTGFTWAVNTNYNAFWARTVAAYMADTGDTNYPRPMPLGYWYDSLPKVKKFYHDAAGNRDVHIYFTGSERYTLWSSMRIDSLSPERGSGGMTVTIYGRGFGDTQDGATVTFAGSTASVTTWSDRVVKVTAPQSVTSGPVVVVRGTVRSNGVRFTSGGPFISDISPDTMHYGDTVVIIGDKFGTRGKVYFDTTEAIILGARWDSTRVVAYVPKNATAGTVRVLAAREDEWGKYDTSNAVRYHIAVPRPVLRVISPGFALADSFNYIRIGGDWWKRGAPPAAFVKIGDIKIIPDYWNSDSMRVRLTPELSWGEQVVTVIDDSMESLPIKFYVGIPLDTIVATARFARCWFGILVNCTDDNGNTSMMAVAPNPGTTFVPVTWSGREFSCTFTTAGEDMSVTYKGKLDEYGTSLIAMEAHYTRTIGDDVTITLLEGKRIELTTWYRNNFTSQFSWESGFGPPGYEIPRDSVPSFLGATGTMYGSNQTWSVESLANEGIPQFGLEFKKVQ